jgi:hypothetical protein
MNNQYYVQPAFNYGYMEQTDYQAAPLNQSNHIVETERSKAYIRVAEAQEKAQIEVQKKLFIDDAKYWRREMRRMKKEAEYREISIGSNGEINVVLKNSLDERQLSICNFTYPQLYRLFGTDGEDGLYLMEIVLGQKKQKIYLLANKISSGKYVLDKIRAVGGMIHCKKNQDAEKFIQDLMPHLISNELEMWIPSKFGWNKNEGYFFVEEGDFIWKEALKKAN